MTSPVIWSSSSLSTMLRCGQQFYYAHVMGIKSPPNLKTVIGVATHTAAETNLRQKIASRIDLPLSDLTDAYSDTFDRGAEDVEGEQPKTIGPAKDSGLGLVRLYHHEVSPQLQPILVEEPLQYSINGSIYATTVDTVDEENTVRDLKTTMRRPNAAAHIFQLIGGALGFRQNVGRSEADIGLDVLIRKQKPEYLPIRWGSPVSPQAVRIFADQIERAAKLAKAGTFLANGVTSYACSSCGYTRICPAYKAAFGSRKLPDDLPILEVL